DRYLIQQITNHLITGHISPGSKKHDTPPISSPLPENHRPGRRDFFSPRRMTCGSAAFPASAGGRATGTAAPAGPGVGADARCPAGVRPPPAGQPSAQAGRTPARRHSRMMVKVVVVFRMSSALPVRVRPRKVADPTAGPCPGSGISLTQMPSRALASKASPLLRAPEIVTSVKIVSVIGFSGCPLEYLVWNMIPWYVGSTMST